MVDGGRFDDVAEGLRGVLGDMLGGAGVDEVEFEVVRGPIGGGECGGSC